jgi:DNA invertase Pin-like site-specific DNA recombinase
MRCVIYARVSTAQQDVDMQVLELQTVATRSGWDVVAIKKEIVSGGKARAKRPVLDEVLRMLTQRKVDKLLVWSTDRLGRSLVDLINTMETIKASGGSLYIHQQALDTASPAGEAMFAMLGIFSQFERSIIQERVRSGISAAKAKGVKFGRPKRKIGKQKLARMLELRDQKMSYRKIAAELDMPFSSVRDEIVKAKAKVAA